MTRELIEKLADALECCKPVAAYNPDLAEARAYLEQPQVKQVHEIKIDQTPQLGKDLHKTFKHLINTSRGTGIDVLFVFMSAYYECIQAKPVPLTEEQIDGIWDKNCLKRRTNDLDYDRTELMDAYSFSFAVREVEAAHGITKEPRND